MADEGWIGAAVEQQKARKSAERDLDSARQEIADWKTECRAAWRVRDEARQEIERLTKQVEGCQDTWRKDRDHAAQYSILKNGEIDRLRALLKTAAEALEAQINGTSPESAAASIYSALAAIRKEIG